MPGREHSGDTGKKDDERDTQAKDDEITDPPAAHS
jgi:hypothetical protein